MTEVLSQPRIITIDGEPGAGKTTTCTLVADRLGYQTLTSGMFYCATAYGLSRGILSTEAIEDGSFIEMLDFDLSRPSAPEISVEDRDITDIVFSRENKNNATKISSNPVLVGSITSLVRKITDEGFWVLDRGSEIFPDADLKVWLQASAPVRAARRCGQLALSGDFRPYEQVLFEILEREKRDKVNPHINNRAQDEVIVDNTYLDEEQTYRRIASLIKI